MSTHWANIGEDQGALHALVQRIAEHVPTVLIDYVWIFPPRRIAIGESIVVVVGAFGEDTDRRRVITAHFTVSRDKKGQPFVNARFDEHGTAPRDAVPRIVDGVLRRLGEDAAAPPREEAVGGNAEQWDALIVELGGRPRSADSDGTADTVASANSAEVADTHTSAEIADNAGVADIAADPDADTAGTSLESNPSADPTRAA